MRNKLLILIKKRRRIFLVITLLLVLLAGGIRISECYHTDFLFKQEVMKEYFKAGLFMGFYFFSPSYTIINEYENFYDYLLKIYDDLLTICEEMHHCFIRLPLLFVKHYFFDDDSAVSIEKIKSPFFKKHILYRVSAYPIPDARWVYAAAKDIDRFKVHEIENDVRSIYDDIRVNQKVIKNFNKLVVKEKIRIKSCEDCLEFIKTFFKLIFREHLIEYDKETFKVCCWGHSDTAEKEHTKTAPFIFKPYEADYYYVELYLEKIGFEIVSIGIAGPTREISIYFIKNTFKVKENGIIYDFNEIVLRPVRELRAIEE